jgi:hypothetical protein
MWFFMYFTDANHSSSSQELVSPITPLTFDQKTQSFYPINETTIQNNHGLSYGYLNAPLTAQTLDYSAFNMQTNMQEMINNGWATSQINPLTNMTETYMTPSGLSQAEKIVFDAMSQAYGPDLGSGEAFAAYQELSNLKHRATLSGIPVNANDIIKFVTKQIDMLGRQHNSMSRMVQSSADRVSETSDIVSSGYRNAVKNGEKITRKM